MRDKQTRLKTVVMDKKQNKILETKARELSLTKSMIMAAENSKRFCVESCFSLGVADLTPEERNCFAECHDKLRSYFTLADEFYKRRLE